MTAQKSADTNAATLDSSANDQGQSDRRDRLERTSSMIAARIDSIALLAGGGLLARAIRTAVRARNRRRAVAQGLLGSALLGFGVAIRRRRSGIENVADDVTADVGDSAAETLVSDDAAAARERHDVRNQHRSGSNPRGVSDARLEDETDASTAADEDDEDDEDDGAVRFTTSAEEPRSKPELEDEPTDPRYNGADGDDAVEIDLSDASVADEASEATGPAPEQSQPALTEDTEPESSPPEDASHVRADVPDGSDADATDDASERGAKSGRSEDENEDEGEGANDRSP